jgi:hypothetical protein
MKNLLILLVTIIPFLGLSGGPSGGACVFLTPEGDVICNIYGNSGVPSETACYNDATAIGAVPINCLDYTLPCVSQIFGGSGTYCFFVGNSDCVTDVCETIALPVELVEFKVRKEDNTNYISWKTASERNSSHFVLSFTYEGSDESILITLPSANNTTEVSNYYTTHINPNKSINYYTLLQYDLNGEFVSYGPISIDNREKSKKIIKRFNLMGQEVNKDYKGFIINIYDDGTSEKVFIQ